MNCGFARRLLCAVLGLLVVLMAACAAQQGKHGSSGTEPVIVNPPEALPESPPPTPPTTTPPLVTRPQPPPPGGFPKTLPESGASPAVLALYRQAEDSRAAGKFDKALSQVERALRIEPRNAFLWQSLGDIHLRLQHADQAESAAQKSTSLAHGNPWLDGPNWRLIAAARQTRGDSAGAKLATSRADALGSAASASP